MLSPGVQAEIHVSVPPLVEVMRGERVTLNCTPSKKPDHFMLEWFLVSSLGRCGTGRYKAPRPHALHRAGKSKRLSCCISTLQIGSLRPNEGQG